jgi:hypothetical protein
VPGDSAELVLRNQEPRPYPALSLIAAVDGHTDTGCRQRAGSAGCSSRIAGIQEGSATHWRDAEFVCWSEYIN